MIWIKNYLNLIVGLIIVIFAVFLTSQIYENKISKLKISYQDQVIKEQNKQTQITNQLRDVKEKLEIKDKEYYEKYTNIQSDNQKLINDVASANRQLRIKISGCQQDTVGDGKSSGLDNGSSTRAVIDSRDAQSIIAITNKADKYKSQLEALQNYIKEYNIGINKINKEK